MKTLLKKLVRRMSKDYPKHRVIFDSYGFSVAVEDKPTISMLWGDIDTIYTQKIDLFSYDEVQLGFGQRSANLVVEVGEQHEGFQSFAEEVLRRYDAIPKDWFFEVTSQAFEQNFKVLWDKDKE